MKRLAILLATAASLAACGSSSSTPPYQGFVQPTGTAAVNFTVDDTANKLYTADQFRWKGSMIYDPTTRKITMDTTWGGPWAPLYDDGPWDQLNATTGQPGHEPKGATAGDHKWGVTVFVTPPATGADTYEYGLVDHAFSDGWIWQGANGSFVITAGSTTAVTATGMTLPPFGSTDMRLVCDVTALDTQGGAVTWDTSLVQVKGGAWAWSLINMYDDGTHGDVTAADHKFTFVLSNWVGAGNQYFHTGLLKSGDQPQFVFVFNGVEYRDAAGLPTATGCTAETKPSGGSWTPATVVAAGTDHNNSVVVP